MRRCSRGGGGADGIQMRGRAGLKEGSLRDCFARGLGALRMKEGGRCGWVGGVAVMGGVGS